MDCPDAGGGGVFAGFGVVVEEVGGAAGDQLGREVGGQRRERTGYLLDETWWKYSRGIDAVLKSETVLCLFVCLIQTVGLRSSWRILFLPERSTPLLLNGQLSIDLNLS